MTARTKADSRLPSPSAAGQAAAAGLWAPQVGGTTRTLPSLPPGPPVPPSRCRRSGTRGRCSRQPGPVRLGSALYRPRPVSFPAAAPPGTRENESERAARAEGEPCPSPRGGSSAVPGPGSGPSAACALSSAPELTGNEGSKASERLRKELNPRPCPWLADAFCCYSNHTLWLSNMASGEQCTTKYIQTPKPKNPRRFIPSEFPPGRQSRSFFLSSPASPLSVHPSHWRRLILKVGSHWLLLWLSVAHSPGCGHLSSCPLLSQSLGVRGLLSRAPTRSPICILICRLQAKTPGWEVFLNTLSSKYVMGITQHECTS